MRAISQLGVGINHVFCFIGFHDNWAEKLIFIKTRGALKSLLYRTDYRKASYEGENMHKCEVIQERVPKLAKIIFEISNP